MKEYLGISFLLPSLLSLTAFLAWIIVARRMLNLKFSRWGAMLTLLWATTLLCMGILDLTRAHRFDNEWRAVVSVFNKTVISIGIIVMAWVRYHEIAKLHPVRMAACPVEPSPTCAEMAGTEQRTVVAAAELMTAAESAATVTESAVLKLEEIHQSDCGDKALAREAAVK